MLHVACKRMDDHQRAGSLHSANDQSAGLEAEIHEPRKIALVHPAIRRDGWKFSIMMES